MIIRFDYSSEISFIGKLDYKPLCKTKMKFQACISGNKLLVERLLAKGHPVNVRDNAGWLPLHEACIHGRLEVANVLINHGANVNDRGGANCDGKSSDITLVW